MQFPHPFTCQMRGANHDVEGFPSGASVRSAVLVGIQGGGTDLAFAGAAFGHQERHSVGFQLALESLRRTELGIEQRVSGVCDNMPIDLLHRAATPLPRPD